MKYWTRATLCLTWLATAPAAAAASPTYTEVARFLAHSPACSGFTWTGGAVGEGAIIVPARINGHSVQMQLDTGAETSQTYGNIATQFGWAKSGQQFYFPVTLDIANTAIPAPRTMQNQDMSSASIGGTIGLDELLGHVVVIDYPSKRFCLFTAETTPPMINDVPGVHGAISHGRFLLPLTARGFHSQRMLFDTGTSLMGVVVGGSDWLAITGFISTASGTYKLQLPSWGKTVTLVGADALGNVTLGTLDFPKASAFTMAGSKGGFYDPTYDGVVGNKLFAKGVVVLDLSSQAWFGFLSK